MKQSEISFLSRKHSGSKWLKTGVRNSDSIQWTIFNYQFPFLTFEPWIHKHWTRNGECRACETRKEKMDPRFLGNDIKKKTKQKSHSVQAKCDPESRIITIYNGQQTIYHLHLSIYYFQFSIYYYRFSTENLQLTTDN